MGLVRPVQPDWLPEYPGEPGVTLEPGVALVDRGELDGSVELCACALSTRHAAHNAVIPRSCFLINRLSLFVALRPNDAFGDARLACSKPGTSAGLVSMGNRPPRLRQKCSNDTSNPRLLQSACSGTRGGARNDYRVAACRRERYLARGSQIRGKGPPGRMPDSTAGETPAATGRTETLTNQSRRQRVYRSARGMLWRRAVIGCVPRGSALEGQSDSDSADEAGVGAVL